MSEPMTSPSPSAVGHTAGLVESPWRVSTFELNTGGKDRMVMGADNFAVAYVSGRSAEEHDYIANLIASAPTLAARLRAAQDVLEQIAWDNGNNPHWACAKAAAFLAGDTQPKKDADV